jgi:tRNA(fMet)-specific endonuclease VapC
MNYMLDTSACVALLRNNPEQTRLQAKRALKRGSSLAVSSIVMHELWYGAFKSSRVEENVWRLRAFLTGNVEILAFDDEDARIAGRIRADLESEGKRIGAYDTLIGGQCLRHELTLVTHNQAEFSRIRGLKWVDWTK